MTKEGGELKIQYVCMITRKYLASLNLSYILYVVRLVRKYYIFFVLYELYISISPCLGFLYIARENEVSVIALMSFMSCRGLVTSVCLPSH